MKRKLFIGSSSEGKAIAKQLQEKIITECGDWIDCQKWDDGEIFALNKGTLDSLVTASRKYDYGVLLATKDDITKYRGTEVAVPRDNVMFEMGMFLGSLGLTRAFLLVEQAGKLPTDYNGVTVPYFDKDKAGSFDKAVDQIIDAIKKTRKSYNLKPVPSAALALGYFENFIQPLAKKRLKQQVTFKMQILLPKSIKDIKTTTSLYTSQNPSEQISVYEDGSRPIVNKIVGQDLYWDIPSTLSTLNSLMNLVIPQVEIGFDQTRQDWIDHEIRNFKGTIDILVEQCPACDNRISVMYM